MLLVRPALVLAALLAAGTAHAADKPVVLVGSAGGTAPDTATAAAVAQDALGSGAFQLGGSLGDALALDSAPVWVLGGAQVGCGGKLVTGEAFAGLLAEASDAVDMLEFGTAHGKLAEAQRAMPCLTEPADPEALYQVWFLAGLSAFQEKKEDEARAAFGAAAVLDPTRPWSDDYAPAGQGLFLEALQGALARKAPPLSRDAALAGALYVDGRPYDGTGELLAGRHLVQLQTDAGVGGAIVTLPEEAGWLAAVPPHVLEAKILSGDAAVAAFLGAALAASGWSEVVLVSELGAARFDVPGARFLSTPGGGSTGTVATREPTPRAAPPPPAAVAGGVLTGVGAGLAAGGFLLSGLSYQRGVAALAANDESTYGAAYRDNVGGFAMGMAGAVATGTGLIVAIASASGRGKGASVQAQRVRALQTRRTLESP